MTLNDQTRPEQSDIILPTLQFTIELYTQSPDLAKQFNEWQHSALQVLAEKNKQLELTKQQLNQIKAENNRLKKLEKSSQEKAQDLEEKDKQLRLAKQELNHLKEGSFKAALIQHGLSVVTALSFGVGINYVTSATPNAVGWLLICIGVVTQSISFYITYSGARKNL